MAIKLDKVSYQDKLKNISYEFTEGKITTVISSSGSGKTLLSYLLSGYTGTITNSYIGRELGYVFQNPEESFIFSNVKEELSFGLNKYNYKVDNIEKRIEDTLKMIGLDNSYLDKNPFNLSSGEKSLLSLGVVLSLNPKLIIIDEPTIYLDNKKEEYLIKLLKRLKNNYHKTIIIFTSNIEFALKISDNYVILKKGKITSKGTNKELMTNMDKVKNAGISIPQIVDFINTANKKKNINLEMTFDIKELSIFFIDSYKDIIMLTSYLILMMIYSDINILTYLRNIYSIKIFLVFILIIDLIFNINNTIYDLYKLIFIIIYSSALTYTTSTSEITYGIERMLRPFNNYIPVNDIAMIITLTIRYIPTLTMEADRIIKAQKMRGINFDNKNIKDKISTLVGVFIPMFVLSLKKSESLGDIMDLRLYNYGKSRTNLRTNKWKKKDSLLLVLNILILSIVIFY